MMTELPTDEDLRQRYTRSATAPVARHDRLVADTVAGFTTIRSKPLTWRNDLMLFDVGGDVRRPIPEPGCDSAELQRTGPSPVGGLAREWLDRAPTHMRECFERELYSRKADGEVVRDLLDAIANRGHRTWLAGGAVRDMVADGAKAQVKDLDFTGTIGPGELNDLNRRLRREGVGNYAVYLSRRLIWSITPPTPKRRPTASGTPVMDERLLEYRPLNMSGFPFPVWGGPLADDAACRDLTVNSLLYDHREDVLIDPTGKGLEHLRPDRRVLDTPYRGSDPVEQASIILRVLKFQIRWRDLALHSDPVKAWVRGLPANLAEQIPVDEHRLLRTIREACVPETHRGEPERHLAADLGPAAVGLLKALQEGTI